MHSFTIWKLAGEPNYSTNIDLVYPYSELPHQGEYKLVKIPVSLNNLIEHVDYWGEGRVVSEEGIRGFPNSYNVNHKYRLVSSGPDTDKKIPNRIPVLSYTDCDTSAYIKDNSVLTVTIAGTRITSSCAKDIARIVNTDHGKVVVYGVRSDSHEILELAVELNKKGLFLEKESTLPSKLQGLTNFDSHITFLNNNNLSVLKETLYNDVVNGNYENAVNISKSVGEDVSKIVIKLIRSAPQKVMTYAYKLWQAGGQDLVRKYFPTPFQYIINADAVTIANQLYDMPLKLDYRTGPKNDWRVIWGSTNKLPRNSIRLSWRVLASWEGDKLTFRLYNDDKKMFLRMDDTVDYAGDRECWATIINEEDADNNRYKYNLEPVIGKDDNVVFIILNLQHNIQGLKLEVKVDEDGDRRLYGHNGNIYDDNKRFRWVIAPWSSGQ